MRAVGETEYIMALDLKVAAVGGSFEGKIALFDMHHQLVARSLYLVRGHWAPALVAPAW